MPVLERYVMCVLQAPLSVQFVLYRDPKADRAPPSVIPRE